MHIAVLMGGWSAERPVSLQSGAGVADALESRGHRVTFPSNSRDETTPGAPQAPGVFCFHGCAEARRRGPRPRSVRRRALVVKLDITRRFERRVLGSSPGRGSERRSAEC